MYTSHDSHMTYMYSSYGVTLWYPSYVDLLTQQSQRNDFQCNSNISDVVYKDSALFCNCPSATYDNVTFDFHATSPWQQTDGAITDSNIVGAYWWVWFYNITLEGVAFNDAEINDSAFLNSTWSNLSLDNVTFTNTTFCNITTMDELPFSDVHFINSTLNGQSLNGLSASKISQLFTQNSRQDSCNVRSVDVSLPSSCSIPKNVDYFTEYRNDLIISVAALPGNITSAILMYFFIRSFWLCKSIILIILILY